MYIRFIVSLLDISIIEAIMLLGVCNAASALIDPFE